MMNMECELCPSFYRYCTNHVRYVHCSRCRYDKLVCDRHFQDSLCSACNGRRSYPEGRVCNSWLDACFPRDKCYACLGNFSYCQACRKDVFAPALSWKEEPLQISCTCTVKSSSTLVFKYCQPKLQNTPSSEKIFFTR